MNIYTAMYHDIEAKKLSMTFTLTFVPGIGSTLTITNTFQRVIVRRLNKYG
jgi:hypothetical protein